MLKNSPLPASGPRFGFENARKPLFRGAKARFGTTDELIIEFFNSLDRFWYSSLLYLKTASLRLQNCFKTHTKINVSKRGKVYMFWYVGDRRVLNQPSSRTEGFETSGPTLFVGAGRAHAITCPPHN